MKSAQSLFPKRFSLVEECARLLREAMCSGRWKTSLPGERELCMQMNVSRPTLREALAKLEKEGLLARDGHRRRTISAGRRVPGPQRSVVSLLSPLEMPAMQEHELLWLDELRRLLSSSGYELKIEVRPGLFKSRPRRLLETISQDASTGCWILYRSNLILQKWFAQHCPNSVVAGSTYEGVALSSVDIDHRVVCRHAVGKLVSRRHQRICYIGSRFRHAGDVHSEEGFLESFPATGEYVPYFARHEGTPGSVARALDGVFQLDHPPTGFIVANSNHTLTTLTHLATRGLVAGRDYALLARDDAPFFGHLVPSVARYANMPGRVAQELSRLVTRQIKGFSGRISHQRIMPDFLQGDSLSAAR